MAENECLNFARLFTTKVIKSHVKLHMKSDAQKVNFIRLHCKFADEVLQARDYSSCSVVLHVVILARLITASANCARTYIVVLSKIS